MANHRAMTGDVTRAAAGILPGLHLDAMIYGCTSGTVAIGEGEISRLIQAARPGIPCTNPITAVLAALQALRARRIALLTPYTCDVNDELAAFLTGRGVAITRLAGFDLDGDEAMTAVPPAAILEAGLRCVIRVPICCSSPARHCAPAPWSQPWKRASANR